MNKLQLFEEMHTLYVHNLLCYSKDYLMTQPKKEFVNEWKKEKEKVGLIEKIIEEEKIKSTEKYVTNKEKIIGKNEQADEFE